MTAVMQFRSGEGGFASIGVIASERPADSRISGGRGLHSLLLSFDPEQPGASGTYRDHKNVKPASRSPAISLVVRSGLWSHSDLIRATPTCSDQNNVKTCF